MRRGWLISLVLILCVGLLYAWAQDTTIVGQFQNGIQVGLERLWGLRRSSATGIVLGGTNVATVTLETATTSGPIHSGFMQPLVVCGDDAGGTTVNYLGPALACWAQDGSDCTINSTACQALDSTTEATADLAVSTLALRVYGMRCLSNATQAAAESLTFRLRSAAADTDPVVECVIGEAATECRTNASAAIAAGATMAIRVTPAGNNAAADAMCILSASMP